MKNQYNKEVALGIQNPNIDSVSLLNQNDMNSLPSIVQKYLHYTGCVGKPRMNNMKVFFSGRIRGENREEAWMKFKAEQYSFFNFQTRLFYIRAYKMGLPAFGLHCFKNGNASMKIKMLGLFTITDIDGEIMSQSETVTLFNDMCCMAPATLISDAISWKALTDTTVEAHFKHGKHTISAVLTFETNGRLINFISNVRYEITNKSALLYPWSTPISECRKFGDYYLPVKAEMIYHKPDGDFCYGEFNIDNIQYNIKH